MAMENSLSADLRLGGNPLDPATRAQYEQNYYNQYIAPQIAAATTKVGSTGQQYGSYGGGLVGGLQAQGQYGKFQAGMDLANQAFQQRLANRDSFFNNNVGLAAGQNALGVNRGLALASQISQNAANLNNFRANIYGTQSQNNIAKNSYNLSKNQNMNNFNLANSQNLNQYNLANNQGYNSYYGNAVNSFNSFNQGNYGTQMSGYNAKQQADAAKWSGIGSGFGLLV